MKIVVLIEEVPDTWNERRIDATTKRVDRSGEVVDVADVGIVGDLFTVVPQPIEAVKARKA
jgi:hypothetical protein